MASFLPHVSRKQYVVLSTLHEHIRQLSGLISRKPAIGFEPPRQVVSAEKRWQALHKKCPKRIDHASEPALCVFHIRSIRGAQKVVQQLLQGPQ